MARRSCTRSKCKSQSVRNLRMSKNCFQRMYNCTSTLKNRRCIFYTKVFQFHVTNCNIRSLHFLNIVFVVVSANSSAKFRFLKAKLYYEKYPDDEAKLKEASRMVYNMESSDVSYSTFDIFFF